MIDLTKKSLPNTVLVNGKDFTIYTDFRIWMRFTIELEAWRKEEFQGILDIRYLFKDRLPEFTKIEDYGGIFAFAYPSNIIPKRSNIDGENVLFYQYDGDNNHITFPPAAPPCFLRFWPAYWCKPVQT